MTRLGEVRGAKEVGYKSKGSYVWHACIDCGKERWVQRLKGLPTSLRCYSCANHLKNLKDGPIVNAKGYVMVRLSPSDFFAPMRNGTGYILEHRLVMAQHLGRCLQAWEIIHHKGDKYPRGSKEDKADNRYPENLELTTKGNHAQEHNKGYADGYDKGFHDGRLKQISELKQQNEEMLKHIKLLEVLIKNKTEILEK